VSYFARGVFYGALFVSTVLILVGSGGGSGQKEDKATAYVLDLPAGRWLVAGVGLGFVGAGLFNFYRGITRKFREKLKLIELSEAEDKAYSAIGAAGFVARGVVFSLVGVFLVRAAYQYDPQEAIGLDGALSKLAHASYGPYLLGLTAAGLFAYGLYSFVEARYREV
jgi:succinate dehydrogenase/fumarate reductase cytochrome b subunit